MTPVWIVATAFVVFGSAAFLGVQAGNWMADRIERFDDGPQPGTPRVWLLIAGSAIVGALMANAGQEPGVLLGHAYKPGIDFGLMQLLVFVVIDFAMIACWCTDVRTGIVPDVFTLGSLGFAFLVSLATADVGHVVMGALVALPFAAAALFSRGRGMGWGDVKLVAVCGITIGFASLLSVTLACLVAVTIAFARRRRNEPIAFAPYLIGSIGVAVAFPAFVPQSLGF